MTGGAPIEVPGSSLPDFERLGRESLWPADEWQSAWNSIASEHRGALWPAIVTLGSGYTRPTRAADSLVLALNSSSPVPSTSAEETHHG